MLLIILLEALIATSNSATYNSLTSYTSSPAGSQTEKAAGSTTLPRYLSPLTAQIPGIIIVLNQNLSTVSGPSSYTDTGAAQSSSAPTQPANAAAPSSTVVFYAAPGIAQFSSNAAQSSRAETSPVAGPKSYPTTETTQSSSGVVQSHYAAPPYFAVAAPGIAQSSSNAAQSSNAAASSGSAPTSYTISGISQSASDATASASGSAVSGQGLAQTEYAVLSFDSGSSSYTATGTAEAASGAAQLPSSALVFYAVPGVAQSSAAEYSTGATSSASAPAPCAASDISQSSSDAEQSLYTVPSPDSGSAISDQGQSSSSPALSEYAVPSFNSGLESNANSGVAPSSASYTASNQAGNSNSA